jgi:hypothetical protein
MEISRIESTQRFVPRIDTEGQRARAGRIIAKRKDMLEGREFDPLFVILDPHGRGEEWAINLRNPYDAYSADRLERELRSSDYIDGVDRVHTAGWVKFSKIKNRYDIKPGLVCYLSADVISDSNFNYHESNFFLNQAYLISAYHSFMSTSSDKDYVDGLVGDMGIGVVAIGLDSGVSHSLGLRLENEKRLGNRDYYIPYAIQGCELRFR